MVLGYEKTLKKLNNGKLWEAIEKYDSKQISVKALTEFDEVVTGLSNYNIYDLLKLWDEYHDMYKINELI